MGSGSWLLISTEFADAGGRDMASSGFADMTVRYMYLIGNAKGASARSAERP